MVSAIVFKSLGGFGEAGDDSNPGGACYLTTRDTWGWSSRSVQTAASSFDEPEAASSRADVPVPGWTAARKEAATVEGD